jgi:uncharacterized membrane protein YheB (UPF0754 family)
MKTFLLFFIPPAIGAVIGYVTNSIAIKMLFRPLKEIRIFGVRLPFTPGILPKQRKKLALSIGVMVERELITPEIIRRRLLNDEVREKVKQAISFYTEKILEKTPDELFHEHKNLLQEKISSAMEKYYPALSASVLNFLKNTEIRKELESKGRILLINVFLKLNSIQRFFLSAGQYDLTLQEKMPEIINDLICSTEILLNESKVRNKFLAAAASFTNDIIEKQNKKLGVLLDINGNDKNKLDGFLFQKIFDTLDVQIENILSSINIKNLVSERIDSLDMIRVERIILDVMADQFKWINIFGGILGSLIGLFQAVFSHLLF